MFRKLTAVIAATLTIAVSGSLVGYSAEDTPPPAKTLQRIEEDWVLLVENPDEKIASPQVLICMSPDGKFTADHALIELNHATQPGDDHWLAGGLQLQGWQGSVNTGVFNSPKHDVLSRGYDRIQFTVSMKCVGDGYTEFQVKDGASRTWGKFGQDKDKPISLKVKSTRENLATYDRANSVKHTHVTHGAHRVTIMYQRRVRYYWSDGSETVDGNYQILHRFQSLVKDMTLEQWEQSKTDYVYEDINN